MVLGPFFQGACFWGPATFEGPFSNNLQLPRQLARFLDCDYGVYIDVRHGI